MSSYPSYLTVFNNALYFVLYDSSFNTSLWRYNGTTLSQVTVGATTNSFNSVGYLKVANGMLYSSANRTASAALRGPALPPMISGGRGR